MSTQISFHTTPTVQLYIFIFLGLVLSLFWPVNMLYVYLATRAYLSDSENLFNSFCLECKNLFFQTVTVTKTLIKKFNSEPKKENKESSSNIKEETEITTNNSENNDEGLRKRNNVSSLSDSEPKDTI